MALWLMGGNPGGGVVEHLPLTQYCVGPVVQVVFPFSVLQEPPPVTVTCCDGGGVGCGCTWPDVEPPPPVTTVPPPEVPGVWVDVDPPPPVTTVPPPGCPGVCQLIATRWWLLVVGVCELMASICEPRRLWLQRGL